MDEGDEGVLTNYNAGPNATKRMWLVYEDGTELLLTIAQIAEIIGGGGGSYLPQGPTAVTVGGLAAGTDLGDVARNPFAPGDILDQILYPTLGPQVSLSGGGIREFGASNAVTLAWGVIKRTLAITGITVNGTVITPTGNSQSGTQAATATQNVDTTFTMSATDGVTTPTASTTVSWKLAMFWGKLASLSSPSDATILAFDGAGVGSGKRLGDNFNIELDGINGAGEYLGFCWPTAWGTPKFTVNGLPNTAYTKIRSNSAFTNANGYTYNVDVWATNTAQNSPIDLFNISTA